MGRLDVNQITDRDGARADHERLLIQQSEERCTHLDGKAGGRWKERTETQQENGKNREIRKKTNLDAGASAVDD